MATDHFTLDPEQHRFGVYARGQQEAAANILEAKDFDPAKRTVIVLPGTRINHELPSLILQRAYVPGMIGSVNASLARRGIAAEDVNTLCLVYTHNDEQLISNHFSDRLPRVHPAKNPDAPTPTGTDAHEFVSGILLPLMGMRNDHRPSVEEACANLAKVTLVGHSFGTAFAHEAARCFTHMLVEEHGYSASEAERMVGEVVAMNIANVARTDLNEPGFRTITFGAQVDRTAWDTMYRIAEDHVRDGLLPADTDLAAKQAEYYAACGNDPALIQRDGERKPTGALTQPRATNTGYGRVILADTAPAIHWTRSKGGKDTPMEMSQQTLDDECERIKDTVKAMRGTHHDDGLNGQPLARPGLTPAHDVRMYFQPAEENAALVAKVDAVLAAAVERAPMHANDLPQISVGALARRTPPASTIAHR